MSLFTDTLCNSFSSAGDYPDARRRSRSSNDNVPPMFSEMELLQVAGIPSELEKFYDGISNIKRQHNLGLRFTIIEHSKDNAGRNQRHRQQRRCSTQDQGVEDQIESMLSPIFSMFIAEPEVHFLRVDGSHDSINALNVLTKRWIKEEDLIVSIKLKSRQVLAVDRIAEKSMEQFDSILDSWFSADLSDSMPMLHSMIVGSA
eukprot:CAMPEP_0113457918 /NCGR_PEP_ID=MMETSP0014_2-20120614/9654_1 /TAXON_ID=2857 /ORGANISM="Nitzschia sp." /LENGTH=201 /DNA_ID=CAMNT_0000349425 /DNA_START=83 /DNA_END=688 /DNA_ORIENTATION=+ /assembly_acc=CAM_ASM_000159